METGEIQGEGGNYPNFEDRLPTLEDLSGFLHRCRERSRTTLVTWPEGIVEASRPIERSMTL
jgi:hypothetical protein